MIDGFGVDRMMISFKCWDEDGNEEDCPDWIFYEFEFYFR